MVEMPQNTIVLMYHSLDSKEHPSELTEKGDLKYVVDATAFQRQMDCLFQNEICVMGLEEGHPKTQFKEKNSLILLTFDDGHITNYTLGYPKLKEYGFGAYFFITTDWIGSDNYMNDEMLKDLCEKGYIIGSHGKTHAFLTDLTDEAVEAELIISKKRLEKCLGKEVNAFSAPGGRLDHRIIHIARNIGYGIIFGSNPFINRESNTSGCYGRFAVTRNIHMAQFTKIVNGRIPFYLILNYRALNILKRIFGNSIYVFLRKFVLR